MQKVDLRKFYVATSETARNLNRRLVLNFLRSNQPISRADLARQSGLQFSTVSLIIEELIAEQWVSEGALAEAPRGRKPRALHFNYESKRMVGVDIRPSITTVAISDLSGRYVEQERFSTDPDSSKFLKQLIAVVTRQIASFPSNYAGIGVSVPGRVDIRRGVLAFAANLGWRDFDIRSPLQDATGLPVMIENAPNACALAEIWFGNHGQDVKDLVAVTVSEGVGAGIFVNGQLLTGPTGMAGEFGHVSIRSDGPQCKCGNVACLEVFASNTATVSNYEIASGKKDVSYDQLIIACREGDANALEALKIQGRYLGEGVAMITTAISPSVIVLVGEVAHVWDIVGPQITKVMQAKVQRHLPTRVVATDERIHPRLRGAVAIVLQQQLGTPLFL